MCCVRWVLPGFARVFGLKCAHTGTYSALPLLFTQLHHAAERLLCKQSTPGDSSGSSGSSGGSGASSSRQGCEGKDRARAKTEEPPTPPAETHPRYVECMAEGAHESATGPLPPSPPACYGHTAPIGEARVVSMHALPDLPVQADSTQSIQPVWEASLVNTLVAAGAVTSGSATSGLQPASETPPVDRFVEGAATSGLQPACASPCALSVAASMGAALRSMAPSPGIYQQLELATAGCGMRSANGGTTCMVGP